MLDLKHLLVPDVAISVGELPWKLWTETKSNVGKDVGTVLLKDAANFGGKKRTKIKL